MISFDFPYFEFFVMHMTELAPESAAINGVYAQLPEAASVSTVSPERSSFIVLIELRIIFLIFSRLLELKNEPTDDWNKHLLANPMGNIFNSIEYAEYARRWLDWKPLFCYVLDSSGNILLQTILFEYVPNIDRFPRFLHGTIKKLRKSIRWNYGPVSSSQECTSLFLSYLKKNYKRVYGITHPLSNLEYSYFTKTLWCTFL